MELYQLQTFVTVAEEGHLTRAADKLCVSQPALSVQLKSLEQELGLKLFERTPRGMTLTKEGGRLLKRARKVLAAAGELTEAARIMRQEVSGVARIGLCTDVAFLRIMEFTSKLRKNYAGIEPHILQSMSETVLENVRDGKMEAGFKFGGNPHRDVGEVHLCDFRLLVVGPASWKDRLEKANDWGDLMAFPWIWLIADAPYCRIAAEKLTSLGLPPKPPKATVVDHESSVNAFVSAGEGLGLMREDEAEQAVKDGRVVIWEKDHLTAQLIFVYKKKRKHSPVIRALVETVRSVWEMPEG